MVQLQLLNYLLQTGDGSLLKVNNVDDTFFSEYPEEYQFIRDHMSNYGQVPDRLTFATKFDDFDWIEVNENPNYLIDELYRDRNKRTLAKVFNGVRDNQCRRCRGCHGTIYIFLSRCVVFNSY